MKEWLAWAFQVSGKEHVSISSFAKKFRFYDRDEAEAAYETLLRNPEISRRRRKRLQGEFNAFKKNHGLNYWSKRSAFNPDKIAANLR